MRNEGAVKTGIVASMGILLQVWVLVLVMNVLDCWCTAGR